MDINLLPWREELESDKIRLFLRQLFASTLLVCVICIILYMRMSNEVAMKNKAISEQKKLQQDAQLDAGFMRMIAAESGQEQLDFVEDKIQQNEFLIALMSFLGEELSRNMYLTKIEKDEGSVYVHGRSASRKEVAFLIEKLRERFEQKNIRIAEMSWVSDENHNVEFSLVLD